MIIIVVMTEVVPDFSMSNFILMIGRQLLFLSMILLIIFFGTKPLSFPLAPFLDKMSFPLASK
jgi:hypothetical protein